MNVLIVDDDPVVCVAVRLTLQNAGYQVTVANDARQALELLQEESLQLVVCDWSMPGMSGLEFCRQVRANITGRYVYVLMLTGRDDPQDLLRGLESGADDYLVKPYNPAELILRVNTGRRIVRSESSSMTIFALARLVESRDAETGAHLERIRGYSRILAEELRRREAFSDAIDDEFVRLIYETSPLHDIGKVAMPDAILLNPRRLTYEEFELMKTHTLQGARTLAAAMQQFPNAEFLRMAHDIALCHHERFDGTGYPRGLVGDEIPLSARIVALADVYDALICKRVYKNALSHEAARAIIVSQTGSHFDPQVVDAFLRIEDEFCKIRTHYGELPAAPKATAETQLQSVPTN